MTKHNIQTLTMERTKSPGISNCFFATLLNTQLLQSLIPSCRYMARTGYQKTEAEILFRLYNKECAYIFEITNTKINPSSEIIISLVGKTGHAERFTPMQTYSFRQKTMSLNLITFLILLFL